MANVRFGVLSVAQLVEVGAVFLRELGCLIESCLRCRHCARDLHPSTASTSGLENPAPPTAVLYEPHGLSLIQGKLSVHVFYLHDSHAG